MPSVPGVMFVYPGLVEEGGKTIIAGDVSGAPPGPDLLDPHKFCKLQMYPRVVRLAAPPVGSLILKLVFLTLRSC